MEKEETQFHEHPLIPFTRFDDGQCNGCGVYDIFYGGYRCNDLGCETVVFHKECAKPLTEINHSSHPDHPLKLINMELVCTLCSDDVEVGYSCLICDFKLDLFCARTPLVIPGNLYGHKHPLELYHEPDPRNCKLPKKICEACDRPVSHRIYSYRCHQCEFVIHTDCVRIFPVTYHTSHPQHPLKLLKREEEPDYIDNKCLLCAEKFYPPSSRIFHCDVCNVSLCYKCMGNPPPLSVLSLTTHEHQLHLIPRLIDFTCNACGTKGDRSPYFCLPCNFMIHRDCIDLPRIININRHDRRITYIHRLGHEELKCGVCRKIVDGFYGGYSCSKCPNYVVHSRCATRKDVWDMVELEGTPEEPEVPAPFEVIDDNTIKHFSHDHNLHFNKDEIILLENTLCVACVFQICSEPFYNCEQCDFVIHKKCANLPRKKRHVCHNQALTLCTDPPRKKLGCYLCSTAFSGFRYEYDNKVVDVRCGSLAEPFMHESHPHPLYYNYGNDYRRCNRCESHGDLICDDCDFSLCFKSAMLPLKVMRRSYDDHSLVLSYGESNVDSIYWCEACETKLDPKKWFYTCNDCGTTLHIKCIVGDFMYDTSSAINTSSSRRLCYVCNSRCKLPSIFMDSKDGVDAYICSYLCLNGFPNNWK